jgi:hypothetical protein
VRMVPTGEPCSLSAFRGGGPHVTCAKRFIPGRILILTVRNAWTIITVSEPISEIALGNCPTRRFRFAC